jgi:tetratricopeptide (TPR) repeat protein
MPIDLIAIAFDQILELAKEKGKRSEKILKALNAIGLKQDAPLDKGFDGVYAYTLVVYGVDKPQPILEFFRHQIIKDAFWKSFDKRDTSILEEETENFLDWNEIGKDIITIDYDPKWEFSEFREQFITAAKLTRTVQEVLVDQKLDDFSDKLTELPTKDYLDSKFEPIYKKLNEQADSEVTVQEIESTVEFSIPSTLFFIGQDEALGNLTKGVNSSNVIMIGGIAGIGKTYLIAHFLEIQTDTKPVLWQDCSTSNQLEQVLLSLSDFFKAQFGDAELWQLLRNPLANEQNKLSTVAKIIDKYQCIFVWDNFDARINQSLIPLLLTLNKLLRQGKLIVTTREFFEIAEAFNPIVQYVVPSMSPEVGIELMKAYLNKLGLPDEPDDLLMEAYKRVGGHPYFMSRLIILSVTLPIRELVTSLPQLTLEAHKYIQERISNQLDQDARKLLQYLSVIQKPFLISAVDHIVEDTASKFDQLTKKFLVTKVSKSSSHYEIHDLVREFELSLLASDDLTLAHLNAADYYANLEKSTFSDGAERVGHLIEGKKRDVAEDVSNNLLAMALHAGLFDFAIDFSNQLIKENAFENWGQIYFSRGRAFRLKENIDMALESYRLAQTKAENDFIKESSLLETSSMLAHPDKETYNLGEAIQILKSLTTSKNIKIKVSALSSLGYLNLKSRKTRNIGVRQLQEALQSAEKEGLQRSVMQICLGLGSNHFKKGKPNLALSYLERARSLREETRKDYGEQDIEGEYHLFDLLARVYRKLGRYNEAARAIDVCVRIDRKYSFYERLALSLHHLGKDLCLSKNYRDAKGILQESLDIIRTHNLGHIAERSTIEWLAVTYWYLNQFELAVELILECTLLNQKEGKVLGKHIVIQEGDLRNQDLAEQLEFTEINGELFHLLVLPKEFNLQDVKQWNEKIVKRRPDLLKAYNPALLYNMAND